MISSKLMIFSQNGFGAPEEKSSGNPLSWYSIQIILGSLLVFFLLVRIEPEHLPFLIDLELSIEKNHSERVHKNKR
jgi:hypothetical protein